MRQDDLPELAPAMDERTELASLCLAAFLAFVIAWRRDDVVFSVMFAATSIFAMAQVFLNVQE
jgi:hypothetical protein